MRGFASGDRFDPLLLGNLLQQKVPDHGHPLGPAQFLGIHEVRIDGRSEHFGEQFDQVRPVNFNDGSSKVIFLSRRSLII